jgi:hypothetical protein
MKLILNLKWKYNSLKIWINKIHFKIKFQIQKKEKKKLYLNF